MWLKQRERLFALGHIIISWLQHRDDLALKIQSGRQYDQWFGSFIYI